MAEDASKISITICGDGGCGKSSITLRLVRSLWTHEYDPTIEDSYSVTRNIDGTTFSLAITDTAGQEEYRSLWSSSNLHSDAFLLVYDITQQSSLRSLEWFNELIEQERERRMERGKVLPVCIVAGNKCDLQGIRQVGATEGLNWARSRGYGFMETSAREMVNIEETFALLVRRVVGARKQHLEGMTPNLPSSTSRTRPLEPLSAMSNNTTHNTNNNNNTTNTTTNNNINNNYSEKALPPEPRQSRQYPQWEPGEELGRKRWWHAFNSLKCW